MCIRSFSESGQPGGFMPCDAYVKLLSEKSRLEGRCAGLEEGNKLNLERIKRQDDRLVGLMEENKALKKERNRLGALCTELEERLKPSKFFDPNGYC